ncbi:MAG TPA: hypothetical protein VF384_03200 [Planctomycetota bacterium]
MRLPAALLLALVAPLAPASAQALIAEFSGLSSAGRLLDFGNGDFANGTPFTTQVAGLTFSHAAYFTTPVPNNNVAGGYLGNDATSGPPNTLRIQFAQMISDISFVYHQIGTGAPTTIRAKLQGNTVGSFTILWNETSPNNFFGFAEEGMDEVQIDFVGDFRLDSLAFNAVSGAAWHPYNGSNINPAGFGTLAAPTLGGVWQGNVWNTPDTVLTAVFFAPAGLLTPPVPLFGGELLLDPSQGLFAMTGTTSYSLAIPSAPSWIGTTLALQALRLDLIGGSPTFVPMNAMTLWIGL